MNQYRYSLARRGKTQCPSCHHRTFVNYLDTNTNLPLADGVCGKCDRADNCGFHYSPRQYFADRGITSTHLRNGRSTVNTQHRLERRQCRPLSTISSQDMLESLMNYDTNNLRRYLHRVFAHLAYVDKILTLYGVGTSSTGAAIFWQIDKDGRVRTGKVMQYDPDSGKRLHSSGSTGWVHTGKCNGHSPFNLQQAFFGSHLLRVRDNLKAPYTIWLMESEKAALIVSLFLDAYWPFNQIAVMATGGCGGLNPTEQEMLNPDSKLQVLKGNNVVLFADQGKFDEWSRKGTMLRGFCNSVLISTVMERDKHPMEVECAINPGDGFDDIVVRYMAKGMMSDLDPLICSDGCWHQLC